MRKAGCTVLRDAKGEVRRRAWPARASASREVGHPKAGMCVSFALGNR